MPADPLTALTARAEMAEAVWTKLSVLVSCSSHDGSAELGQVEYLQELVTELRQAHAETQKDRDGYRAAWQQIVELGTQIQAKLAETQAALTASEETAFKDGYHSNWNGFAWSFDARSVDDGEGAFQAWKGARDAAGQ